MRKAIGSQPGRLLALLVAAAGCRHGEQPRSDAAVEAGPVEPVRLVATGPAAAGGPVELYRPYDMALIGDSIALVDNGNDRLVLLDESMSFAWASGRSGSGPGEYRAPFAVRPSPGGLMLVDIGNGRFTELDRTGTFIRSVQAPHTVSTFGVRSDGVIVMPARLPGYYAYFLSDDGPVAFAPRDTATAEPDMFDDPAVPPFVSVTQDDTIHIFDDRAFRLSKYTPDGDLVTSVVLPLSVRDSIADRFGHLAKGLANAGHRVIGAELTKGFEASVDGRLLILLNAGRTRGFVIDAHTYETRRLVVPEGPLWKPLASAKSGMLSGRLVTVLSGDSVYTYELGESGQ